MGFKARYGDYYLIKWSETFYRRRWRWCLKYVKLFFAISLLFIVNTNVFAKTDKEIAKTLENPISTLVRVPIQLDYNRNIGIKDEGHSIILNIYPVIPFSINKNWTIVTRTSFAITHQKEISPDSGIQNGFEDIDSSIFIAPNSAFIEGTKFGFGPIISIPAATDKLLGSGKWELGPTIIFIKQDKAWTYGIRANHLWSVAGDNDREKVSTSLLQPMLSYTTNSAISFSLKSETKYNWVAKNWTVPINLLISRVSKINEKRIKASIGLRYWAKTTDTSPEGFGVRTQITFMFE